MASSVAGSSTSGKKKKASQPRVVPSSQIVNFNDDGEVTTQELVTPDNKGFRPGSRQSGIEKKILLEKADSIASSSIGSQSTRTDSQEGSSKKNRMKPSNLDLAFDAVSLDGKGEDRTRVSHGQRSLSRTSELSSGEDTEVELDACSSKAGRSRSNSPTETGSRMSFVSALSRQSSRDTTTSGMADEKLTPMKDKAIGGLIPINSQSRRVLPQNPRLCSASKSGRESEDSMSVKSFSEESDYASTTKNVIAKVRKYSEDDNHSVYSSASQQRPLNPVRETKGESRRDTAMSSRSSVHSAATGAISREDLKQALLSVMERKEELSKLVAELRKELADRESQNGDLAAELAEVKRTTGDESNKLLARVQAISRENELLKHQLKKYVGAVQKLRDGPQAHETLASLERRENETDGERRKSQYVDYHYEASEYERKLIQVAEMHGELIEFNEHLQRQVQAKDIIIQRMRNELVELRGPLPNGDEDETASVISETGSTISASVSGRALLHIWIPSVFMSGQGSRTHHVYQVYLRIKDDEWNIYRRYSDFHKLHQDLKTKDSSVETFDFPPKKRVGYKADKVVEERRKKLQSYLRRIVNLMVQSNPALTTLPNKESVLALMPFFAESVAPSVDPRGNSVVTSPTSIINRQRSQSQPRSSIFARGRQSGSGQVSTAQLAI